MKSVSKPEYLAINEYREKNNKDRMKYTFFSVSQKQKTLPKTKRNKQLKISLFTLLFPKNKKPTK